MSTLDSTYAGESNNRLAVVRWFDEAWNRGNYAVVKDLYQPNYVANWIPQGFSKDATGLCAYIAAFRAGMPDLHFQLTHVVEEGDRVAVRFLATGTQDGALLGIPPTGRSIKVSGMVLARLEEGKWAEDWANWDQLGFLRQLGVAPSDGVDRSAEPDLGAAAAVATHSTTLSAEKALIRRFYEECWNEGDLAALDEIFAPDCRFFDPAVPALPPGPNGPRLNMTRFRAAFPDIHFAVEDLFGSNDYIVCRWRGGGTQLGDFARIPASGRAAQVDGMAIWQFVNGKAVRRWDNWDLFQLLQQIGAIPS